MIGKFIIVFLILHAGCSILREKAENNVSDESDILETLVIDKIPSSHTFNLSDLCSSIRYVQLDTAVDVFFPNTGRSEIVRDNILYTLDGENGCLAFNITSGKQTLNIGNIGHGPMDMSAPNSFYPDLKRNRIEIFDAGKRNLVFFGLNGEFLQRIDFSSNVFFVDFSKTSAGEYLFYTANQINVIDGVPLYETVIFSDTAYNITKSFFPVSPELSRFHSSSSRHFTVTDDAVLFWYFPGSMLYDIAGSEPRPILKLDFKEKNIPESILKNEKGYGTKEYIDILKEKGYSGGISLYQENDACQLMSFIAFDEFTHYYILRNKGTGHYQWFRKDNFINDIDDGIVGDILHMDNDRIIMIIEPYLLWDHAHTLKQNRLTGEANRAFELLNKISHKGKEGNPILMIGQLKKSGKVKKAKVNDFSKSRNGEIL